MNKTLTIAIPTYNRDEILKNALEKLLPQCALFGNDIEIIISDNASTDNTQEVILTAQKDYQELNIVTNRNKKNLGFSGNFTKCIELSKGNYIWVLSDDDFLENNVLEHILGILKKREIGVLFLEHGSHNKKEKPQKYKYYNNNEFFKKTNFRLSLISACIFNRKGVDNKQLKNVESNELLGLVPVLNSLSVFDSNVILEGENILTTQDEKIRFSALKIFVIDLKEVLNNANKIPVNRLANSFICTNILYLYILWKFNGEYKSDQINNKVIYKLYKEYWCFWCFLLPFILLPKFTPVFLVKVFHKIILYGFINRYVYN